MLKPINQPNLTTKRLYPENQESPIHFLNTWKTPIQYFYIRNHFNYPSHHHWLTITGEVSRPLRFHYYDLLSMPSKTVTVPLECAGNKRSFFSPKVYGEQWEEGAMSQGSWTGVPLKYLLDIAKPSMNGKEVIFSGSDAGKRPQSDETITYSRSLPIEKALHPDTLIAYNYNELPLSYQHGFPFRLIVPGWYAMASVKWLQSITVSKQSFKGPFQTDDYMYYPYKDSDEGKKPVTYMNVNSSIFYPLNRSIIKKGSHLIQGIAWSGLGKIVEVEISFDEGETWITTELTQLNDSTYSWTSWKFKWHATNPGEYILLSRAKDSHNRIQPMEARWNRKGYGYNAVSRIDVEVE